MTADARLLDLPAPDFDLSDTNGQRQTLSAWLDGSWGLLIFLRHLSCLLCRAHLDRLKGMKSEIEALGLKVAAVTFETLEKAKAYAEEMKLAPWPLLVDSERKTYEAYGMIRGSWWQVLQPANWVGYGQLFLQGYAPRIPVPGTDVFQLGGDVLIDPQRIVRLHDCSEPAARVPEAKILEIVRAAVGQA